MANQLTIENASYEQLIASNTAKTLQNELHLTETQIAKGNLALLDMLCDEKLVGATQVSKMRFAYRTALLNYKHSNAIAPVKFGNGVMALPQYQAYMEDMAECGGVEESNAMAIYKGIDYKAKINKWGYKELTLTEIELKDPFQKLEVVGYYAYAKCKDGEMITCLMSIDEIKEHAQKYSSSFRSGKGVWVDSFDRMALKTPLRAVANKVLHKYPYDRLAQLIKLDQQVFTDNGTTYADNPNANVVEANVIENTLEKPTDSN